MGTSKLHWQALHLDKDAALGKKATVTPWSHSQQRTESSTAAHTITLVVDTYAKTQTNIRVEDLENIINEKFQNEIFCKDQRWILPVKIDSRTFWLALRVATIYLPPTDTSITPANDKENESKSQEKKPGDNVIAKAKKGGYTALKHSRFGNLEIGKTNLALMSATNPYMNLIQPQGMILIHFFNAFIVFF